VYGRRDLVHAYLGAQRRGFGGYYAESSTFNDALEAYYVSLLDGLQQLFDLRLDQSGGAPVQNLALLMLLRSAADSLLTLRTPWSGFLEAGLIYRKLDAAGEHGERVTRASARIDALVVETRDTHLEMLDALLAAMLGDRAGLTFTEADVRAAGVDTTKPSPADYPLFDD
jgi:hypothetical protein